MVFPRDSSDLSGRRNDARPIPDSVLNSICPCRTSESNPVSQGVADNLLLTREAAGGCLFFLRKTLDSPTTWVISPSFDKGLVMGQLAIRRRCAVGYNASRTRDSRV